MSKTDKTKPFWVKVMHGDLATVEAHNHTDGHCDLPPAEDAVAFTYGTTQCRREFRYTGTNTCCCPMCHGDSWGTRPEKRRRIDNKRMCRNWERDYR